MRVLIIDDSEASVRHLEAVLTSLGQETIGRAQDGAEGVRAATEGRPDVIFLDLVMPQMDGLAALRVLRRVVPNTQVIVVTSVREESQISQALGLGAAGVVYKPFQRADIHDALFGKGA
ncbi:MAG: response regulator [Myxococcota bacterium]